MQALALHTASDADAPSARGAQGVFDSSAWSQAVQVLCDPGRVVVTTTEIDPASGHTQRHWLQLDVGRRIVNLTAAMPYDFFVLEELGADEFVIERWRVTPPRGGYHALRPPGGPTRSEIVGAEFIEPQRRGPASVERSEIARLRGHGRLVTSFVEADARYVLAIARRGDASAQALRIDVATGDVRVLADSERFPGLSQVEGVVRGSHAARGAFFTALTAPGPDGTSHKLVFLDVDRDGEIDEVLELDDAKWQAAGFNDPTQWDGRD